MNLEPASEFFGGYEGPHPQNLGFGRSKVKPSNLYSYQGHGAYCFC